MLRVEATGLCHGDVDQLEILPGSAVYRLRDDLPAAELTIFEALSCTVTWVRPVTEGHTVVVEGPGHMGLATVVAARAAGAGTIIVTGLTRDRAGPAGSRPRRRAGVVAPLLSGVESVKYP